MAEQCAESVWNKAARSQLCHEPVNSNSAWKNLSLRWQHLNPACLPISSYPLIYVTELPFFLLLGSTRSPGRQISHRNLGHSMNHYFYYTMNQLSFQSIETLEIQAFAKFLKPLKTGDNGAGSNSQTTRFHSIIWIWAFDIPHQNQAMPACCTVCLSAFRTNNYYSPGYRPVLHQKLDKINSLLEIQ